MVEALAGLADITARAFAGMAPPTGEMQSTAVIDAFSCGGSGIWAPGTAATPAAAALAALKRLALTPSAGAGQAGATPLSTQAGASAAPAASPSSGSGVPQPGASFAVQRTPEWAAAAGGRLASLFQRLLPPLCGHPRHAVRRQLAALAMVVLEGPAGALPPECGSLMAELLLTLAQDEWPQVTVQNWFLEVDL